MYVVVRMPRNLQSGTSHGRLTTAVSPSAAPSAACQRRPCRRAVAARYPATPPAATTGIVTCAKKTAAPVAVSASQPARPGRASNRERQPHQEHRRRPTP